MAEKKTNSFFKRLVSFLHFLFACVTLVGIGFMYLNSNYGRGLDWIKTETFEQSPDFSKKVQADITNIFDYVQYQDIFEVNGEVDYSQVVLEVTTGPGGEKSYTLDDIIQYGKSLGYYMDESDNYALKGGPETLSEEDQEQVYVRYRCYQDEADLTSPDQSFSTMPDLTYEILKRFSAYYYIADVRASANFSQRIYALEGYLSPNTYEIYTSATPEEIIKKLLSQTEAVFRDEWHDRADALGMTMDRVITLASLIEKEAKQADFARVSAVFHNRLKINMALGSDVTIKYVTGTERMSLNNSDLSVDSPYNTYRNKGLPPGPICNPSAAAIEAALYPDETFTAQNYLYFCSKDPATGELYFSRTLEEHEAAVKIYAPLWQAYDEKTGAK